MSIEKELSDAHDAIAYGDNVTAVSILRRLMEEPKNKGADSQRLDWLESSKQNLTFHPSGFASVPGQWRVGFIGCLPSAMKPSIRSAIDASINEN